MNNGYYQPVVHRLIHDTTTYGITQVSFHDFRVEFFISIPESKNEANDLPGLVCIDSIHAAESVIRARRILGVTDIGEERISESVSAILLFLPEDPRWVASSHFLPLHEALRLCALSVRYHVNSSVLWRFRASKIKLPTDMDTLKLLVDLSGFKDFNYYLFEHWLKISEISKFVSVHLPRLRSYMLRNPRNFSPYHIILRVLERSADTSRMFHDIMDYLDFPDFVRLSSPAYRDFIVSAGILLTDRDSLDISSASAAFEPFLRDIQSFIEAK